MNNIDDILERIQLAKDEISNNFNLWNNQNRDLLREIIISISESSNHLFFDVNDNIKNHEILFLKFRNKNSHFSVGNTKEQKSFIESGAYLAFTVTHKGNLNVWMCFPIIEDLFPSNELEKDLAFIEQKSLDRTTIEECVEMFLTEVWEYYLLFYREPSDYESERIRI